MTQPSVLLVEDNPDDAELTLLAFKEAQIANPVVHIEDGLEALDYLFARGLYSARDPTELPVIVLLDLKLPTLGGIEVLKSIRADERTKHLPIVILTSSAEDKDRLAAYGHHANSYVQKPVDHDQFTSAARHLGIYWLMINLVPPGRTP